MFRYHSGSFLYLDNLCVDFRLPRAGIGTALLKCGIQDASAFGYPIITETTKDIVSFYEKSGYRILGDWVVHAPLPSQSLTLAVLRREPDAEDEWNNR